MRDYLTKTMAFNGQFRIYTANTTRLVTKAQQVHNTEPVATTVLGRTLTGTALLSAALLKKKGLLTVKIQGNGPLSPIVADGNAQGQVKGYLHYPESDLPQNDSQAISIKQAVGQKGTLAVTKDLGLKTPFTGQVPLISGEIGQDLTYYLAKSEQIPSAVGVSVSLKPNSDIKSAGGFLIQVLPGAQSKLIEKVEKRISSLPAISALLAEDGSLENLIHRIVKTDQVEILTKVPLDYCCNCSKEKFAKALASLSAKELETIINEDHQAETICRFCGKKYFFNESELEKLLKLK
ncbi:Hsp33 family molecular chaperone HslO [Liquorilactobacillus sicerae]|uniref:Hsp33 family molecular chaperone HslO n=1 Tax=Liquorilactobacillus sicerae TaxID=1416943 RepID=UPI0024803502|nr:Hsp33 family molecular chaperone HslO [Liquorilactobacillus sicerae]